MTPSTHHIIPENERYCIWMDAAVVDYKLCTCNFACDACAFDAGIRTRHTSMRAPMSHAPSGKSSYQSAIVGSSDLANDAGTTMLEKFFQSIDSRVLPDDRLYSSHHTWVKPNEDGLSMLGIDHFIGTMLATAHSVAFSVPPTHIKAGEPYAWIVANGEMVAVCSPVAGTIVENNTGLADRSCVIFEDPYQNGWIAKIRPDAPASTQVLRRHDLASLALKNDSKRYAQSIRTELAKHMPHHGTTMYDGGTMVYNFEEILGTKKYYEILEQFIRP